MPALLTDPLTAAVGAGVVGLCIGSFLNVVVHRLPKMLERGWRAQCAEVAAEPAPDLPPQYNLVTPRSQCPACGHAIAWYENIPVVSFLALRGHCSACGARISARYPMVEVLTGALSIAAVVRFGATPSAAAACLLLWALIALTFIDLDTQLLPDGITLPLTWAGLLANTAGLMGVTLRDAVLGAVAGYLFLWAVYWAFRLIRGKEGMGYGDFKLLAALGAWLGWQMLPLIVLLSSLAGAIIGIGLVVLRGRDHQVPLAFGPFLAIGGAAALFFGKALVALYLR